MSLIGALCDGPLSLHIGGQKARVSLARAVYSDSDIALLDDPLSAVDAHVGSAILDQCLLDGPLASKTRILVTHALHVLAKTDYIYVIENGVIREQGTYEVKPLCSYNTMGHLLRTPRFIVFAELDQGWQSICATHRRVWSP